MRIAITGTHGTGKTLLSEQLAQATGLPLIEEQARVVAAEMGLESCEQLLHDKILAYNFQTKVLERQIEAQLTHKGGFVSDRCGLDCIAYWRLYGLSSHLPDAYITKARLHTWKRIDLIVYVPPLIRGDSDSFRLTSGREDVDSHLLREIRLLKRSKRVGIHGLHNTNRGSRLEEILQCLNAPKVSS